jgi:transposase
MAQKQAVAPYKQFAVYMTMLYAQGFTNAAIAQKLGVNERTIYKWISKERKTGPLLLLALEKLVVEGRA